MNSVFDFRPDSRSYAPLSLEKSAPILKSADELAQQVNSCVLKRRLFQAIGVVSLIILAGAALPIGGVLALGIPLAASISTAVVATVTVVASRHFALKNRVFSRYEGLNAFTVDNCRESGKMFLESPEKVEKNLDRSFSDPRYTVIVHKHQGRNLIEQPKRSFSELYSEVYSHFVNLDLNEKTAKRRTNKLLNRLNHQALDKSCKKLKPQLESYAKTVGFLEKNEDFTFNITDVTVRIVLNGDNPEIRAQFSLCISKNDRAHTSLAMPVLITESYKTRVQTVAYEFREDRTYVPGYYLDSEMPYSRECLIPERDNVVNKGKGISSRTVYGQESPDPELLKEAIRLAKGQIDNDIKRYGEVFINDKKFESSFDIEVQLRSLGYNDKQVLERLHSLHQGILDGTELISFSSMIEFGYFPAKAQLKEKEGDSRFKNAYEAVYGSRGQIYRGFFFGREHKDKDYTTCANTQAWCYNILDTEADDRVLVVLDQKGRYDFGRQQYSASSEVIHTVPIPKGMFLA